MKLEYQVCSIELAEKLKELGVKQKSRLYWLTSIHHKDELSNKLLDEKAYPVKQYSAFTVAELGLILPRTVTLNKEEPFTEYELLMKKKFYFGESFSDEFDLFTLHYEPIELDNVISRRICRLEKHANIQSKKEADARAKMLIYLIENKFINVNEDIK